MPAANPKQYVELFHLVLLDQIGRKLNKQKYVLKGGCNLRFFFKSPRYSDDMDFDIQGIPVEALRERMRSILAGKPLKTILEVRGIAVEHVTEHKQTETTQRWKFGLRVPGQNEPVPTKVEFSIKSLETGSVFEPVSLEIVRFHQLPPLMANHYAAPTVWRQKINAVVSRAAPQARDIFDLYLLLGTGMAPSSVSLGQGRADFSLVKENVLAVDFGQFKSQVISYLEPDVQPFYDSEETWDAMRRRIIEALGERP
jgi:predicted nucleotidyltransferase component of viral defense system